MKKAILLLKLIVCVSIAFLLSDFLRNNSTNQKESKKYPATETFLKQEKKKDLKKIKEGIYEINHPKPVIPEKPNLPDLNGSPKDVFQQNKILMIGDSFVEGMEAYGALYSSNTIWQRGKRIDDMTDQLEKAVSYQPNFLILSYGSNDVQMWDANVDGFINAYRKSLDNIHQALPNTKVYVCAILPVSQKAKQEDPSFQYVDLFNQRLKQLCDEKGITFIDSSYLLTLESDPYGPDGIHPKGYFYEKWAENIVSKMRE